MSMVPCRSRTPRRPKRVAWLLPVLLAASVVPSASDTPRPLTDDQKLLHALNRLGYGPRPGELEQTRQLGLNRWLEAQLSPASIDDKAVDAKIARLTTLQMPAPKLAMAYIADRANFVKMAQQKEAAGKETKVSPRQQQLIDRVVANDFPSQISLQALGELRTAKVLRAAESKRQLQEVLVDFWGNHFNLDIRKGPVRTLILLADRDVIRPHVFGKFRDMLGASAKSPAMLVYLDNVRSTVEREMPGMVKVAAGEEEAKPAMLGGINENYARELMELHTLGVDGGYTQADVQEVARCFTGWSIDRDNGQFRFNARRHDNGAKTVLGQTIPANGGIRDGERVLDILAAHPSTAKFLARKLCVRLVADEPPATLVTKAAKTFTDTGGDLRAVVRTIVFSPEFTAPSAYRAKIKSPFEYAISAVRAINATMTVPDSSLKFGRARLIIDGAPSVKEEGRVGRSLIQQIGVMGQPLFAYQAPTGYSEDSRDWVSSGALVSRLNFALALAGGQIGTVSLPPKTEATLDSQIAQLLGGEISAATRATINGELAAQPPADGNRVMALLLGSPEFQRR